jgi:hypothetical protein
MKTIRSCDDGLFRMVGDDGVTTLGEFDTRPQAEWFARTGETLSAAEAAIAQGVYMAKLDTARAIVGAVKSLAQVNDLAGDLVAEYWDVGSFTDADVEALGITAAQLTACITTLEQAALFMSGGVNTPVVHRQTLNAVRRVTA